MEIALTEDGITVKEKLVKHNEPTGGDSITRSILLIARDEHLPKHLQRLGSVFGVKTLQQANDLLMDEKFDLVVLGPPYNTSHATNVNHSEIKIIEKPDDLRVLFEELNRLDHNKPPNNLKRRIRADSGPISYESATGTILLVTTNILLVNELKCFSSLLVATNEYSAQKLLLNNNIDLLVWDSETFPVKKLKTNVATCLWGIDATDKKDVYMLLTTGQLSLD